MEYLLIGICSAVIIFLLICIYRYNQKQKEKNKKAAAQKNLEPVRCPICQSELYVGEQLVSKVFRPMNVPDQIMTVSGCPHCYPTCEPGVRRQCPVCHNKLEANQALTARLFNKAMGKKHVHIIGCTNCHKSKFD